MCVRTLWLLVTRKVCMSKSCADSGFLFFEYESRSNWYMTGSRIQIKSHIHMSMKHP